MFPIDQETLCNFCLLRVRVSFACKRSEKQLNDVIKELNAGNVAVMLVLSSCCCESELPILTIMKKNSSNICDRQICC